MSFALGAMKKIYIECLKCHHTFSTGIIKKFSAIIMNDIAYKCENCGNVMDFYDIHVCTRDVGNEACSGCRFRFLCYTNNAVEKV